MMRSLLRAAGPALLLFYMCSVPGCASETSDEGSDSADATSGVSEASFVRPVVLRDSPLSLANPNGDPVTRPIWGGAFTFDKTVHVKVSLDAKKGTGGVLFGGRSDPEAENDESIAVALVAREGGWSLRELKGSSVVQDVAIDAPRKTELTIAFVASTKTVTVAVADRKHSLKVRGAIAPSVGTYVTLDAGAELVIGELKMTEKLATSADLGTPLRKLAAQRGIAVGTATDVWPPLHDAKFESLLAEQFDTAAPTEFYWPTTRGEDQDYFFLPADLMVNFAHVHQQKVNGYFLTWDFELPQWVQDIGHGGDESALGKAMDDHIRTLVGRYKGKMNAWLVANEAIWGPDENNGGPARYGDSIWHDVLGPEYIERAFRVAHEVDPGAQLLYNETGAEAVGPKADFMVDMAKQLVEKRVPINGIGLQFHLHHAKLPKMEDVKANFDRIAALGLDIYITELDVSLEGRTGTDAEKKELQANVYRDVLKVCLSTPRCKSYTVFGFGDRYAWDELGDASPLMFDKEYVAKPAFFSVQTELSRR
jgi:endo-1,4-beta-xylanase